MKQDILDACSEIYNLLPHTAHDTLAAKYHFLDAGYFSTVYRYVSTSGTAYALKLGGYKHSDAGGHLWLDFCLEHQHLACIPKIYCNRVLDSGVYIVLMELLEDADDGFDTLARCIKCDYDYVGTEQPCGDDVNAFIQAFRYIRGAGQLDLHTSNYMVRESDGMMVITDPFSDGDLDGGTYED